MKNTENPLHFGPSLECYSASDFPRVCAGTGSHYADPGALRFFSGRIIKARTAGETRAFVVFMASTQFKPAACSSLPAGPRTYRVKVLTRWGQIADVSLATGLPELDGARNLTDGEGETTSREKAAKVYQLCIDKAAQWEEALFLSECAREVESAQAHMRQARADLTGAQRNFRELKKRAGRAVK